MTREIGFAKGKTSETAFSRICFLQNFCYHEHTKPRRRKLQRCGMVQKLFARRVFLYG